MPVLPRGLDGLFPIVGDNRASMLNTPLLPMFHWQETLTTNNNNHAGQTVGLAAAKLNYLYGGNGNASTVPTMGATYMTRHTVNNHIAAARGEFGQPVLGVGRHRQEWPARRLRAVQRSLAGLSGGGASGGAGSGGAERDGEGSGPVVLNDVAGCRWLRTLRLGKHAPNFEGTTWKEMVEMDEQTPEAQGSCPPWCPLSFALPFLM
ncbi:hypothetical protein EDB85DRAFT_1891207 [Lactarius pseudohatsudake]|nr:hypothetical protein EDB85DRAFT_1891207 [Lactarius pseudohatsudake]